MQEKKFHLAGASLTPATGTWLILWLLTGKSRQESALFRMMTRVKVVTNLGSETSIVKHGKGPSSTIRSEKLTRFRSFLII
jgi:hypothetical protein